MKLTPGGVAWRPRGGRPGREARCHRCGGAQQGCYACWSGSVGAAAAGLRRGSLRCAATAQPASPRQPAKGKEMVNGSKTFEPLGAVCALAARAARAVGRSLRGPGRVGRVGRADNGGDSRCCSAQPPWQPPWRPPGQPRRLRALQLRGRTGQASQTGGQFHPAQNGRCGMDGGQRPGGP